MRKYKSDTWDSGNYLTRFYEVHDTCGYCGGSGQVMREIHICCGLEIGWCECSEDGGEVEERVIDCHECGGSGEIVYYY